MVDTGEQPDYWWQGTVGCEGGPLLVCGADAFAAWGGATLDAAGELDPACDFGRAHAVLYPSDDDEFAAGLVRFGEDGRHTGVVWEMEGAGVAEVAMTVQEDSFLVMRSWVRNTDAPRRFAAGPAARAAEQPVGELDLRDGRVAIVWAPVGAAEVGAFTTVTEAAAALRALNPPVQLNLEHILGIGTVRRVRPGRYRAGHGSHEGTRGRYAPAEEQYGPPVPGQDEDWSCRWIRLTRLPD